MKILHISDLHYKHTGNRTRELVDKIINQYKNDSSKPVIINSGDLIEKGTRRELSGVKFHMKKLVDEGFDLLLCPGNHDVRRVKGAVKIRKGLSRFNTYLNDLLPKGKNYQGEEDNNLIDFPIVHKYDNYFFIGLDSNKRKRNFTPSGKLGNTQLQELEGLIEDIKDETQDAVITVYLHHNPFRYSINIRNIIHYKQMKLVDRHSFLKIIKNKVDVLLFGHAHWDERYADEEDEYGFKIAQLSAKGTHTSSLLVNEIDLENFTMTSF